MKPKIDPAVAEAAKARSEFLKGVADAELRSALEFVTEYFGKTIMHDKAHGQFIVNLSFTLPEELVERWAK